MLDCFNIDDITIERTREVTAPNGRVITCRYLDRGHFEPEKMVCRSLHTLFVLFSIDSEMRTTYQVRSGIESLLEYIQLHNARNPTPLHVTKYTDINSEVFSGFQSFVKSENRALANIAKLKGAMKKVADQTGRLPLITLPMILSEKKTTEPLQTDGYETLQQACISHVRILYEKLEFRKEVDKATPYTASEAMSIMRPPITKARLIGWHKFLEANNKASRIENYRYRFTRCVDADIRNLAQSPDIMERFQDIYEQERHSVEYDGSIDPFRNIAAENWRYDNARLIKTLITNGFPLEIPHQEVLDKYSSISLDSIESDCTDIVQIILYRLSIKLQRSNDQVAHGIDNVLALYYPTLMDMSCLVVFMLFQSGWNKETVMALDQHNFEHTLTGAIEAAVKIIYSEKNKSQGIGLPYENPKRIHLPTRDDDPLSMYNLIGLCKQLSAPLANYPMNLKTKTSEDTEMNPLFLYLRIKQQWTKLSRHSTISFITSFSAGVKQFLSKYEVIDGGKRITCASDFTRKLRPTWLAYKKKDNPLTLLSTIMGHSDRDTTDIYYDDSGIAKQERAMRLRNELESIVDLLRSRQFKGILSPRSQTQTNSNLKIFHIPGFENPMWACANQHAPDWAGSHMIASSGKKCFSISNCIFCSQMRIFQESLPYLIERSMHLQEIIDESDGSNSAFDSRITKEEEAILFILDEWGDEDDIKLAARYRRRNSPLLPRDLKMLEIIFESEDFNL